MVKCLFMYFHLKIFPKTLYCDNYFYHFFYKKTVSSFSKNECAILSNREISFYDIKKRSSTVLKKCMEN